MKYSYTDEQILNLIGRKPVYIQDISKLEKFYSGKTILITGGAGSIGSELVKLLITLNIQKVVVFDWWENGIFELQNSIDSDLVEYVIGDIKTKKIKNVIRKYEPEVVIHAAAYKHCPLMQENGVEAFNNNVWGSLNVMEAASEFGCDNFILISSDKAVNPTGIMGVTKRITEILMEQRNGRTKFDAVRFGNVIQSNGSVIPTFLRQLSEGKDLTVTHKDITRYFMTKREAAELILLSATISNNGDIFLLDMGEPIRIYDLAERLIQDMGSNSDIVITGLRKGEKMFEELCYNDSLMEKTQEGGIFVVKKQKDSWELEMSVRKILVDTINFRIEDAKLFSCLRELGINIKDDE